MILSRGVVSINTQTEFNLRSILTPPWPAGSCLLMRPLLMAVLPPGLSPGLWQTGSKEFPNATCCSVGTAVNLEVLQALSTIPHTY